MPNFWLGCLDIDLRAKQNISNPFKSVLRGSYMSVGIVLNEIGNLGHFPTLVHFSLNYCVKFRNYRKFTGTNTFFHCIFL